MSLQYPEQFQQLLTGSLCAFSHVVSYLQNGMFSHIMACKLLIILSTASSNINFFSRVHHPLFLLNLVNTFIVILIESQCNCYILVSHLILGMSSGSMFISSFFFFLNQSPNSVEKADGQIEVTEKCLLLHVGDKLFFFLFLLRDRAL